MSNKYWLSMFTQYKGSIILAKNQGGYKMKGFEIVLVNYKEKVYIPLAKLRQMAEFKGGDVTVALVPVDSWTIPPIWYAVEHTPVKTYRLADILASNDFVEVIVPKPVLLKQGVLLKEYINNELAKVNAKLGVNLKEEMVYWED